MIRVTRNENSSGKVNVFWQSRNNFYKILEIVKSFVGAYRKDRLWRINTSDVFELCRKASRIKGETIHVDMDIYVDFSTHVKEQKSLIKLRDTLTGIDSGIKLQEPFALLPFQHVAVEFISQVRDGLIADKVGLGKTLSGLGSALKLYNDDVVDKCFIIMGATIMDKWQREIAKFLGLDSVILNGTRDDRTQKFLEWQKNDTLYAIISYDTIKKDWFDYMNVNTSNNFMIIMDEVQKIKNPGTKRAECCRSMSKHNKCQSRVGLSATYIETGLENLFGIMLTIDQQVFGESYMNFYMNFLEVDYMGKVTGYKNVELAHQKMRHKSVRRNKEMVQDQLNTFLPKVNENNLWVEPTKRQKELHNEIVDKAVSKIKDMEKADKINVTSAMTELGYLRQVAISAELIDEDSPESKKLDILKEILPEIIQDNKVVIFCFYTGFIDMMERELNKEGIKTYAMHGKRKEGATKNRQPVVDKFEASKDVNVLLTSDILKEGIDIPAASYVINMDILYNPAGMTQRNGRIDRLNQQAENIYVINIWCKGTYEEAMYDIIYNREELANQIMDGGVKETRHRKLTFKDMKAMLRKCGGKL